MKEITTKEIIYVFEKTPTPYISRAVLITMGVVKQKMEVGDFIEAGGTQATFKICTEVRNEKGERACKCPEREAVPDPPRWDNKWEDEKIEDMKQAIFDHYAASAFNCCKLQPQPKMSGLQPVVLHVDEEKYKPDSFTQASNIPLHLKDAAKASLDYDLLTGTLEKVPENENSTKHGVARTVFVAKPTNPGEPAKCRRTVDYKKLNAHINPAVYHMDPPLIQAQKVKSDSYKSVLDLPHAHPRLTSCWLPINSGRTAH